MRPLLAVYCKHILPLGCSRYAFNTPVLQLFHKYMDTDSWFTTEPFVKSLSDLGQDVIGMVKDLKQRYYYNGHMYTLPQLAKIAMDRSNNRLYRSLMVRTRKHYLPVRIVFVKNRNKKS